MAATNTQKHQAGRHLAVARALLRGYPARLLGESRHVEVNGRRTLVQVAGRGAWIIADVDAYLAEAFDRVILVDIAKNPPILYLLPGDDVRSIVRQDYESFLSRVGGIRPRNPDSRQATIKPARVQAYREQWSVFD